MGESRLADDHDTSGGLIRATGVPRRGTRDPRRRSGRRASPVHLDSRSPAKDAHWLAVAMLADAPDIGTGDGPREALRAALAAPGEPWASEVAARAELPA